MSDGFRPSKEFGYAPEKVLQYQPELDEFLEIIRRENICSYLEIGSKWGGTLWTIGRQLPEGSRLVAVDLPKNSHQTQSSLEQCVRELQRVGYDAHLFLGNSLDNIIIQKVQALGPYDLCLIDAKHTELNVRKDWKHYGSRARIVAFHDIAYRHDNRTPYKSPIDVPKVWNEIKQKYRYVEFKLDPTGRDNGLGILWRN